MTKKEAFKEINETQNYYINELIDKINNNTEDYMKVINFQSPTGTGKTKMMAKLINLMPDVFFVITTLSKGQLDRQISTSIQHDCANDNFVVYGCQQYTISSKLQANDILNLIPKNTNFIWIRDEGHINTNRWENLLKDKAFKTINFTATPDNADIKCNFANTMMLRTVHQSTGTPEDAIKKLLEVKQQHINVLNYNPCAIFRCIDDNLTNIVITLCQEYKLRYINITEENFNMSDLCQDDNSYDVIINKFKIVEGIDIRRAHVLFLDNQPSNNKTTIQLIGRCRRNALLYRDDIDIFNSKNEKLLENTRQCFVYYNVAQMHIDEDEDGELVSAFCDTISVEQLKTDSVIKVKKGILPNGLKIIELDGVTGTFKVLKDKKTGFNIINPESDFYKTERIKNEQLVGVRFGNIYYYYKIKDLSQLSSTTVEISRFNYVSGEDEKELVENVLDLYKQRRARVTMYTAIKGIPLIPVLTGHYIKAESLVDLMANTLPYFPYTKVFNDKESAIIGTDIMKHSKNNNNKEIWIEDKAVTSKINKASKFNSFIEKKYKQKINSVVDSLFTGHNDFNFDAKCNRCLGYCVEYYSKYLVYGNLYLNKHIIQARKEAGIQDDSFVNDNLIIRACMLKYRELMEEAYGSKIAKLIPTISIQSLIKKSYIDFVKTVVELGTKAADFVKKEFNITTQFTSDNKLYDPNLSIKHITGLADYINQDTIIDIKTTNYIDKSMVKQVLAYHYLSTKRSDLKIKTVIVYDTVSGKFVKINL